MHLALESPGSSVEVPGARAKCEPCARITRRQLMYLLRHKYNRYTPLACAPHSSSIGGSSVKAGPRLVQVCGPVQPRNVINAFEAGTVHLQSTDSGGVNVNGAACDHCACEPNSKCLR